MDVPPDASPIQPWAGEKSKATWEWVLLWLLSASIQSLPLLQSEVWGAESRRLLFSLGLCVVVRTRAGRLVPGPFLLPGF